MEKGGGAAADEGRFKATGTNRAAEEMRVGGSSCRCCLEACPPSFLAYPEGALNAPGDSCVELDCLAAAVFREMCTSLVGVASIAGSQLGANVPCLAPLLLLLVLPLLHCLVGVVPSPFQRVPSSYLVSFFVRRSLWKHSMDSFGPSWFA